MLSAKPMTPYQRSDCFQNKSYLEFWPNLSIDGSVSIFESGRNRSLHVPSKGQPEWQHCSETRQSQNRTCFIENGKLANHNTMRYIEITACWKTSYRGGCFRPIFYIAFLFEVPCTNKLLDIYQMCISNAINLLSRQFYYTCVCLLSRAGCGNC